DQLKINGEKLGVDVFSMGDKTKPADIAAAAYSHAKKNGHDTLIIDTAGRLHIDQEMMDELKDIRSKVDVDITLLTVDAMTGQDAVKVAEAFDEQIGIDGVVLTKLDGDTRGGAALSVRAVTGKPIYYAGMGEKLTDLEPFYPDRMSSRILGMGDVLTLIDKAQENIDEAAAEKLVGKVARAQFDFDDYLESIRQMRNMGGLADILKMLPGMGSKIQALDMEEGEKQMAVTEAMIYSMTPEERANPDILNPSRKNRIARGSGLDIAEVNRIIKSFNQTRKMMKQMPGMMKKGKRRGGFPGFPF
ncbi:MAG: signal recognition particle protein, partial [Lachnospiraceae bacterium]|nr:signal recognition particle protein [Lachnospiraceae bacterium]